jgi:hypothetical protein
VLKGVEAMLNPGGVNIKSFFLRLTCQIEADVICKGEATRRDGAALDRAGVAAGGCAGPPRQAGRA